MFMWSELVGMLRNNHMPNFMGERPDNGRNRRTIEHKNLRLLMTCHANEADPSIDGQTNDIRSSLYHHLITVNQSDRRGAAREFQAKGNNLIDRPFGNNPQILLSINCVIATLAANNAAIGMPY